MPQLSQSLVRDFCCYLNASRKVMVKLANIDAIPFFSLTNNVGSFVRCYSSKIAHLRVVLAHSYKLFGNVREKSPIFLFPAFIPIVGRFSNLAVNDRTPRPSSNIWLLDHKGKKDKKIPKIINTNN